MNSNNFDSNNITVFKPKILPTDLILFPIKYDEQALLLKTPYLTFHHKGIQKSTFTKKQYITLLFPNIFTKKHIDFYRLLLQLTKWLQDNKKYLIRSIDKQHNITISKKKSIIKKIIDDNFYEPRFTMNLYKQCLFFNKNNNLIDSDFLNLEKYQGKMLVMVSSIWFYNNQFGFSFHCLQMKCIPIITKCLLFNDKKYLYLKSTSQKQKITCPHCEECIRIQLPPQENNMNTTQYNKFIKMKQVGVPLMAIKMKLQQQQLNYQDFLKCLQNDTNNKKNIKNKPLALNELLAQKNKLKKSKKSKKSKKPLFEKFKPKNIHNYKVPSLQDILSTLHSLKPVKY